MKKIVRRRRMRHNRIAIWKSEMIDAEILEAIGGVYSVTDSGSLTDSELTEIEGAIKSSVGSFRSLNLEYEKDSTHKVFDEKIPTWIRPLALEDNLNSALGALEAAESIKSQEQSRLATEAGLKFSSAMVSGLGDLLKDSNVAVQEAVSKLHDVSLDLDSKNEGRNLRRRLALKMLDMIHYTRAAQWASNYIYGIPAKLLSNETDSSWSGLTIYRETLRCLVNQVKEKQANEREVTHVISLKTTQLDPTEEGSGYLIPKWDSSGNNSRTESTKIGVSELEIDLSRYLPVASSDSRLVGIGIGVLDSEANLVPTAADQPVVRSSYWSLSVKTELEKNEILGPLPSIDFMGVAGSKRHSDFVWGDIGQTRNIDPRRKWTLNVSPLSSKAEKSTDKILEIFVAFRIIELQTTPI